MGDSSLASEIHTSRLGCGGSRGPTELEPTAGPGSQHAGPSGFLHLPKATVLPLAFGASALGPLPAACRPSPGTRGQSLHGRSSAEPTFAAATSPRARITLVGLPVS